MADANSLCCGILRCRTSHQSALGHCGLGKGQPILQLQGYACKNGFAMILVGNGLSRSLDLTVPGYPEHDMALVRTCPAMMFEPAQKNAGSSARGRCHVLMVGIGCGYLPKGTRVRTVLPKGTRMTFTIRATRGGNPKVASIRTLEGGRSNNPGNVLESHLGVKSRLGVVKTRLDGTGESPRQAVRG